MIQFSIIFILARNFLLVFWVLKFDPVKSVIYLWHNRALIFGVPTNTVPHSHYALQLSIGLNKEFGLRCGNNQSPETMRAALIGANVQHSFDDSSGFLVNLYLDAESIAAREIVNRYSFKNYLRIEPQNIEVFLPDLQNSLDNPFSCEKAFALTENILQVLFWIKKVESPIDSRIERALEILKTAPGNLISTDAVAEEVFLSPSRFAHLFRAEVGLPVRRYLLWRRLRNAVHLLNKNESLTTVAHAAGFADSAHLTRTFRQMFGITPSEIFQNSQFVQVSFCDQ